MTKLDNVKTVPLNREVIRYVREQVEPLTAAQRDLIETTRGLGEVAEMQIPPEQGAFLTLLAKSIAARTVVEVGTFTGYSTMALAAGLAPGGTVITCDVSTEWASIATSAWTAAGVAGRIQPKLGPAADTLRGLPADTLIDLAFIDADKVSYITYWELLVPRVRPGGLLIADNVLYSGEAVSPAATGNAKAIRDFNAHVLADHRVESVMLTIADGLTLARKKP
ncbi:MAG TPA: class I SAM-dependent methyltransferase [Pseudonocardiaceae bacterium]|nr:class I SAM-dependent methyltransferase [Pseudonocardiaceae bacterium]